MKGDKNMARIKDSIGNSEKTLSLDRKNQEVDDEVVYSENIWNVKPGRLAGQVDVR